MAIIPPGVHALRGHVKDSNPLPGFPPGRLAEGGLRLSSTRNAAIIAAPDSLSGYLAGWGHHVTVPPALFHVCCAVCSPLPRWPLLRQRGIPRRISASRHSLMLFQRSIHTITLARIAEANRAILTLMLFQRSIHTITYGRSISCPAARVFGRPRTEMLRSAEEAFTFQDHGHVRIAGKSITVHGKVTAFRLRAAGVEKIILNGKEVAVRRDGDFVLLGEVKAGGGNDTEAPRERGAPFGEPSVRPDPREGACPTRTTDR